MRTSTAYFAGAGTVVAAIVAGVGGGLLIANIVSPHSSKNGTEMTRLEQRMSAQPIPVIAAPSEPVPYVAATQAAAATNAAPQAQPGQGQQTQAANTSPTTEGRDNTTAAPSAASTPAQSATPAAQPVAGEQAASPPDTKARDAHAVVEKRRYDRRQQWAEKRRYHQRQDQELREVEQRVREQTEPTPSFAAEPARLEMPRIRLFEAE